MKNRWKHTALARLRDGAFFLQTGKLIVGYTSPRSNEKPEIWKITSYQHKIVHFTKNCWKIAFRSHLFNISRSPLPFVTCEEDWDLLREVAWRDLWQHRVTNKLYSWRCLKTMKLTSSTAKCDMFRLNHIVSIRRAEMRFIPTRLLISAKLL